VTVLAWHNVTFQLPHITNGSFQSHRRQPTTGSFQSLQRSKERNKPSVRWKSSAIHKIVWWHFQVKWASGLQFDVTVIAYVIILSWAVEYFFFHTQIPQKMKNTAWESWPAVGSSISLILIHRFPLSLLLFRNHCSLPVPIHGYHPSLLYLGSFTLPFSPFFFSPSFSLFLAYTFVPAVSPLLLYAYNMPIQLHYTYGDSDVISTPAGFHRHLVGKTLENVFHCDSAEIRFVGKIVIIQTVSSTNGLNVI